MAVNSLGDFDFIKLESDQRGGAPAVPQLQVSIVQRPGVDGNAVIQQGIKADLIQMRSVRDVASVAAGNEVGVQYQQANRDAPWVLVFQGINYSTTYSVRYFVKNVAQIAVTRLARARGGVMGTGAGALVTAVWTLQPVAYEDSSSGGGE
jgi:hypothetical protein